MKSLMIMVLLAFGLVGTEANAKTVSSEMDSLGANRKLVRKAKRLDPKHKVAVVQSRAVDRWNRLELGVSYGGVTGGDPYLDTSAFGGQIDFHFSPLISVGYRFASYDNDLTAEGDRVFKLAEQSPTSSNPIVPDLDQPQESHMATVSIYPFYGKLALFQSNIVQFDLYGLIGYGQMQLESGSTDTYAVGGGLGAWISQTITSRLEIKYQGFSDQVVTGSRDVNWTTFQASIGILL